tara:strand:+ start:86 stop:1144 length:1059 start_codon:yes stop_codon:yes gene_type:complete
MNDNKTNILQAKAIAHFKDMLRNARIVSVNGVDISGLSGLIGNSRIATVISNRARKSIPERSKQSVLITEKIDEFRERLAANQVLENQHDLEMELLQKKTASFSRLKTYFVSQYSNKDYFNFYIELPIRKVIEKLTVNPIYTPGLFAIAERRKFPTALEENKKLDAIIRAFRNMPDSPDLEKQDFENINKSTNALVDAIQIAQSYKETYDTFTSETRCKYKDVIKLLNIRNDLDSYLDKEIMHLRTMGARYRTEKTALSAEISALIHKRSKLDTVDFYLNYIMDIPDTELTIDNVLDLMQISSYPISDVTEYLYSCLQERGVTGDKDDIKRDIKALYTSGYTWVGICKEYKC